MHLHLTTPRLELHTHGRTTLILFSCYVNSSHGNGETGARHGGFFSLHLGPRPLSEPQLPWWQGASHRLPLRTSPPRSTSLRSPKTCLRPRPQAQGSGGATAWRCVFSLAGHESSTAVELRRTTLEYKKSSRALVAVGARGLGGSVDGDSFLPRRKAVPDGTNCERFVKSLRMFCTRYAMLRWGTACGTIVPRKLRTAMNSDVGLAASLGSIS